MNQKFEITKKVLESMGLPSDELRIKKTIPTWWVNTRNKEKGGLRLTEQGFESLCKADIKYYEIKFDEPLYFTNQVAIWIDRNIDCPFYITNKKIYVFGEKMAVQLVLFEGNIQKFKRAQERFTQKSS